MSEAMIATWDNVGDKFGWDGSLRDIYVLETTLTDWQSFLDWLRRPLHRAVFSVDGIESSLPTAAAEVFGMARESNILLALHLGGIQISCHFFAQSEIEHDIDPRQINAGQLPHLFGFLVGLGDQLQKHVQVTCENDRDRPFLLYDHKSREVICCPK